MYKLALKDKQRLKFLIDNYDVIRQYNNKELDELSQKFKISYSEIVYDIQTIAFTKFNMKYYK